MFHVWLQSSIGESRNTLEWYGSYHTLEKSVVTHPSWSGVRGDHVHATQSMTLTPRRLVVPGPTSQRSHTQFLSYY